MTYASSWVWTEGLSPVQLAEREAERRGIPLTWIRQVAKAVARASGRQEPLARDYMEAMYYWPDLRAAAKEPGDFGKRARKVLQELERPPEQLELFVPNPSSPFSLKPVHLITDRAKRYRARNAIEQPAERCAYCGSPPGPGRRLEVDHINGIEDDNDPANLVWACRRCNTIKGIVFAQAGKGKRTRQFNPKKPPAQERHRRKVELERGAQNLAQYMEAINALHGRPSWYTLNEAIQVMRATQPWVRSIYAREIWRRRRSGARWEVPF